MKRSIITFFIIVAISAFITPNVSLAKIKNRFTHGPSMIARNIEYISHSTKVTYEITYNIFLHPEILKNMLKPPSSQAFKISHSTVITQSKNICKKSNSNICTVYLWSNLNSIPIGTTFSKAALSKATGYVKYYKKIPNGKLKNYEYKWKPLDKKSSNNSTTKK